MDKPKEEQALKDWHFFRLGSPCNPWKNKQSILEHTMEEDNQERELLSSSLKNEGVKMIIDQHAMKIEKILN